MKKTYTIKEVAQRTGISAYTLRYYDKAGLLNFIERGANGLRLFKDEDFEQLYTISCLKKSGMSIKDIKRFMDLFIQGNSTIHERLVIFEEQKAILQAKMKELEEMMEIVDFKCWYFQEAEKRQDIDFWQKLPEDEVDERIHSFNRKVNDFRSHGKQPK